MSAVFVSPTSALPPEVARGAPTSGASPPGVIELGLLGHGRVGRALCDLLAARGEALAQAHGVSFRVATVLVRDAARPRDGVPFGARVVDDVHTFLSARHDVVVEALGGLEPAATAVTALLSRGTSVVSANKLLLAERGDVLASASAASGAALRYEASVAAGVPLFSVLERSLLTTRVRRVAAVLNGTSNFVLSRVARGGSSAQALDDARRLGLAESDASLDVCGADAAHKIRVLSAAITGRSLPASAVDVRGIEAVRTVDCARAAALGFRLKPLACAEFVGRARGWVAPAAVPATHPLASVEGARSGVLLQGDTVEDVFLAGPGAGPKPTAASIVDDLIALARESVAPARRVAATAAVSTSDTQVGRPERSRRLVAFAPDEDRSSVDETLAFLARSGIAFRQLREVDEPSGPVVVGVTSEVDVDALERAGLALRTVDAVREWTSFRVV